MKLQIVERGHAVVGPYLTHDGIVTEPLVVYAVVLVAQEPVVAHHLGVEVHLYFRVL